MSPELQEQMRQITSRNEHAKLEGVPALERLVEIAEGDNDQAGHIRRFLLGMYNGKVWPFDLSVVRLLDPETQEDLLRVMRLDWALTEVHRYLDDGEEVIARFRAREAP